MTALLVVLLALLGVGLVCGVLALARRHGQRRRVQTLIWDPAERRWTDVRDRPAVR